MPALGWLDVYGRTGMRTVYFGDEAVVDITTFRLDVADSKGCAMQSTESLDMCTPPSWSIPPPWTRPREPNCGS